MKEFDDIERLFSDTFSEDQVTPPKSVKTELDRTLFPGSGKGMAILRHFIWMLPIIFMFSSSSITISSDGNKLDKNNYIQANVNQADFTKFANKIGKESSDSKNNEETKRLVADQTSNSLNKDETPNEKTSQVYLPLEGAQYNVSAYEKDNPSGSRGLLDDNGKQGFPKSLPMESQSATSGGKLGNIEDGAQENTLSIRNNLSLDGSASKGQEDELGQSETHVTLEYNIALLSESNSSKELMESKPTELNKEKQAPPITLDLYTGITNGVSSYGSKFPTVAPITTQLRESVGFQTSVELTYRFGNRIGLTSGLEYTSRNNEFFDEVVFTDSTYVGDDITYVVEFDTVNQIEDTIDIIYTPIYELTDGVATNRTFVKNIAVAIPLYFKFEKALGTKFTIGFNTGLLASFHKYTILSNELNLESNHKRFGLSMMFRPELTYQVRNFGVGVYFRSDYNFVSGLSTDAMRARRFGYGTGLRLKYQF